MKYTCYTVINQSLNESYLTAGRGILNLKKFRIQNKLLLNRLKECAHEVRIIHVCDSLDETLQFLKDNERNYTTVFRIEKKIPVIDKNGNSLSVYADDERFISGEFKSIHKDYIIVKDASNNKSCISRYSVEYLSGKYVGIMKNTVCVKNLDGTHNKISTNDPDYLSGKLKHISSGTVVVKDSNDVKFRVASTDKRIGSELFYINSGKTFLQSIDCKRQLNLNEKYQKTYSDFPFVFRSLKNDFLIKDYCKHGDLKIQKREFNFIYKNSNIKIYCPNCREEYLNNLVQSENQHIDNRKTLETLSQNGTITSYFKEQFLKTYYLQIYSSILQYSADTFIEKLFQFRNNIKTSPYCQFKDCKCKTTFSKSAKHYNLYCDKHKFTFNTSISENELFDYITSLYKGTIIRNDRSILSRRELDIFIPELNIAFEYNGLYNHSDIFKEKKYHYNKFKDCKNKHIDLITVWEDDWHNKRDIVNSIIKNRLGINNFRIGARKTELREVAFNDAKEFLNINHIQGSCAASVRLGLYYDNNLISLMTFGKKRMIMKYKSSKDTYEMIRFCNKLGFSISGGASKLFHYFLANHNVKEIISYSASDYFDGNLYLKLGFIQSNDSIGYWWAKDGIKYHRSNFMKHLLIDKSKPVDNIMKDNKYMKIYNSGNIKWIYEARA